MTPGGRARLRDGRCMEKAIVVEVESRVRYSRLQAHGAWEGRDHRSGSARVDAGAPAGLPVVHLRSAGVFCSREGQTAARGGQKHGISAMESCARPHADA